MVDWVVGGVVTVEARECLKQQVAQGDGVFVDRVLMAVLS